MDQVLDWVIDVKDLVDIMIQLMNSNIENQRFIINSDHMSYKKLMTIISKCFKKQAPYIQLNKTVMKVLIGLDIIINKIRGKRIELSTDAVKYTTSEILLDSSKLNNAINFNYRDVKKSLQECIHLFMKNDSLIK